MNARAWSRRSTGTTFVTDSHALDAPPWIHATCTKRKTRRRANVGVIASTPKAATYTTGRTSISLGTPNRANKRLVTAIESRKATAVARA